MIARIWHGRVSTIKADAYLAFLEQRAVPDYAKTPGNLSVQILRRTEDEVTHFIMLTHWESRQSIRAFAGDQIAQAKYYPEDSDYLLEFEPEVKHYEVCGKHGSIDGHDPTRYSR